MLTLVLIAQAIFPLGHVQTDRQTDKQTDRCNWKSYPRRWLYSQHG